MPRLDNRKKIWGWIAWRSSYKNLKKKGELIFWINRKIKWRKIKMMVGWIFMFLLCSQLLDFTILFILLQEGKNCPSLAQRILRGILQHVCFISKSVKEKSNSGPRAAAENINGFPVLWRQTIDKQQWDIALRTRYWWALYRVHALCFTLPVFFLFLKSS